MITLEDRALIRRLAAEGVLNTRIAQQPFLPFLLARGRARGRRGLAPTSAPRVNAIIEIGCSEHVERRRT